MWPLSLFLPHHHLGDLWSECQGWKYTNRYSLIIYSQVYIPKTATFHYFQLHWKQYLQKLTPSLILPVSKYNASQQVQCSKHQQRSHQQIQAAHVRTAYVKASACKVLAEVHLYYLLKAVHCFITCRERVLLMLSRDISGQAAGVLMLRMLDLRLAQHNFARAARSRNLVEIGTAPVDVRITPHNSVQQIICLGWGYWMQMHIPSS